MSENHRTHDCPCNPTCMRLVSLDASCSSASRDMPSRPATPPLPSAPPAPLPPTLLPTLPTLSGCLGGALPSTPPSGTGTLRTGVLGREDGVTAGDLLGAMRAPPPAVLLPATLPATELSPSLSEPFATADAPATGAKGFKGKHKRNPRQV